MRVAIQDKELVEGLVLAAFDGAQQRSKDPRQVARLAVDALCYVLRRARWPEPKNPGDDAAMRFGAALRLWPDLFGEHRPSVDDDEGVS